MLIRSQPLSIELSEKYERKSKTEIDAMTDQNICSQYIGRLFDDLMEKDKQKIEIKLHLEWIWRDIKGKYYNIKYAIRNRYKWRRTLNEIRPWEGFDGLISVMQTHLIDYLDTEIKYGHSLEEYKNNKITTVEETLKILERMKEPDEYYRKRREKIEQKYPEYKSLITKYKYGGTSTSGDFVRQGDGWAGMEAGKDPRRGYFEFINNRFEVIKSPDQKETDRLLTELDNYYVDIDDAYKQAEQDSDNDFNHLNQLLKENLYTWWD